MHKKKTGWCGIFCCTCRYHHIEGRLRKWLTRRRKLRVCLTKRMLIRKAKEISSNTAALKPAQLECWWAGIWRRRDISSRRVTSYRCACDETVMPLVRRYRATLHDAIRKGKIQWLADGDETKVSLEPVPTKCLDDTGANRVVVKINGMAKNDITAYLHFAIRIPVGVDKDGDEAVVLGDVVRLKKCSN